MYINKVTSYNIRVPYQIKENLPYPSTHGVDYLVINMTHLNGICNTIHKLLLDYIYMSATFATPLNRKIYYFWVPKGQNQRKAIMCYSPRVLHVI